MVNRVLSVFLIAFLITSTSYAQSIIINEINYNSATDRDTEDWVEIYNKSASTVDISGWVIKDSNEDNSFIFPASTSLTAGEYLVIVRDLDDFKVFFPEVTNVIDSIDFNFGNGGELVRLFDDSEVLIDQVEYDDEGDWPTEPDGDGPTLELKDPELDNSLASSWGASNGFGTPGAQNSLIVSNEETPDLDIPTSLSLSQNYPNPFNPSTSIEYFVENSGDVNLEVFDVLGQKVSTLVNQKQTTGIYNVNFDASNLPSGIYMYRLRSNGITLTKRMTLIK